MAGSVLFFAGQVRGGRDLTVATSSPRPTGAIVARASSVSSVLLVMIGSEAVPEQNLGSGSVVPLFNRRTTGFLLERCPGEP